MKEKEIYNDILLKSKNLKTKFNSFFKNKLKENNLNNTIIDDNIINMINSLLFGFDSSNKISKNDFHKQYNLLKQLFLKLPNIDNTLSLMKDIIYQLDEYINYINTSFAKLEFVKDRKMNNCVFIKMRDMLNYYSWSSMHIRSDIMTLKTLIRNSGWIQLNKPIELTETKDIGLAKPDTLKRFYFEYVYDLKNSVKLIDETQMIFGETNTIMQLFNKVFEYIFKYFICVYNIITTNIEWIAKTTI